MPRALSVPAAVLLAQLACAGASAPEGDDSDLDTEAPDTVVYRPSETGDDTAAWDGLTVEILDQPFRTAEGDTITILGKVELDRLAATDVALKLTSSVDGSLTAPTLEANGRFTAEITGLSVGVHDLTFVATAAEAGKRGRAEARVGVCTYPNAQTFDSDPLGGGWTKFGDAYWDSSGWMEITGNAQSRAGSVYFTERKVDPGDFRLEFDIATGGGINSGADGYAVNIVSVDTVGDLAAYVNAAQNGGCLGYGVTGGCQPGMTVESFHIEFDTWENAGDPIDDPTSQNHIAITMDGDPGDHVLWTPFFLEDLQWRHITVEAQGERLRVSVDGQSVINQSLAGFHFDGGWIGVSGSTGWASNWHRFDNLRILDRCSIPGG